MDFDEDDPQEIRIAYVDWRLDRVYHELEKTGDNLASEVMDRIKLARQHLPQNVADQALKRITEAKKKVPTGGEEAGEHHEVVWASRRPLDECETVLYDFIEIEDDNFPYGEDDYPSPENFRLWNEFRNEDFGTGS